LELKVKDSWIEYPLSNLQTMKSLLGNNASESNSSKYYE
jgi:hypothetical protein